MTPEVAKRLKEITVDVKTVSLPAAVNMNAAAAVNITGKWNMAVDAQGQTLPVILELKQAAAAFDGSMTSALGAGSVGNGKVSGSNVTAVIKAELQGQPLDIVMEGKVDGNKMSGTLNVPGFGILPFTAEKAP